jgi:hypothetical protein
LQEQPCSGVQFPVEGLLSNWIVSANLFDYKAPVDLRLFRHY